MATDFRSLYDRDFIGHWDLMGRDVTVTIARVTGGELTGVGGRKTKKPVVFFEGKARGLALNKTNGKTIMGMYGPLVEKWTGKRVTLFKTTTQFGSEQMDCIRIRPQIPPDKKAGSDDAQLSEGPPPEAPESLGDEPAS